MKNKLTFILTLLFVVLFCGLTFSISVNAEMNANDDKVSQVFIDFGLSTLDQRSGIDEFHIDLSLINQYQIDFFNDGSLRYFSRIKSTSFSQVNLSGMRSAGFTPEIENLYSKGYIPADYKLLSASALLDHTTALSFFKHSDYGTLNPYSMIKIVYDNLTGELLHYVKHSDFDQEIVPNFTANEAVLKASTIIKNTIEPPDVTLLIQDVNEFFPYNANGTRDFRLVYKLKYNNIIDIYRCNE